jgi:hypothetical protein
MSYDDKKDPLPITSTNYVLDAGEQKVIAPNDQRLEDVEANEDLYTLIDRNGAIRAEAKEHGMTFTEGVRLYPRAIFWSFAISLCIIMEGYDTALPVSLHRRLPIPASLSFPSFNLK